LGIRNGNGSDARLMVLRGTRFLAAGESLEASLPPFA
jgi:hypothetical protein